MNESVLACYFACAAGVDHEDDWIDAALARIASQIQRGEWDKATASCDNFVADMEGHFAFEELVIAQTEFAGAGGHRSHHAAGLAIIRQLLGQLPAIAAAAGAGLDTDSLLARLRDFGHHAKAHVARYDQSLCRHAGRLARVTG